MVEPLLLACISINLWGSLLSSSQEQVLSSVAADIRTWDFSVFLLTRSFPWAGWIYREIYGVREPMEMSFLKDIFIDNEAHFMVLIVQSSSTFSELFGYTACRQLLQMFISIIFFHVSEYILALVFHGKSNVSFKSLLISKHYALAMICSLIEYLIEIYFFPVLKEYWWISNFGLAMVVLGEIIRKLAIVTAGQAFTHLIKVYHEENHQLVTNGIYRFVRHPGYCGFFIWSVGTQIMLCNPISTAAFTVVVWKFFSGRIPYEEFFLKQFFGSDYEDYMRKVPSGIPLVR